MRRVPAVALLLVTALGAAGCDWSGVLARLGRRSLREVDADRARAWIEEGRGVLVQVRDLEERLPALPGALRMAPDAPVPEAVRAERGWVVVVGSQRDAALRLGAHLARAGVTRVAVATGDVAALAPLLSSVQRAAAPAQRGGPLPHPSATRAGDRPQGER
jgi:hypothetical protein